MNPMFLTIQAPVRAGIIMSCLRMLHCGVSPATKKTPLSDCRFFALVFKEMMFFLNQDLYTLQKTVFSGCFLVYMFFFGSKCSPKEDIRKMMKPIFDSRFCSRFRGDEFPSPRGPGVIE